MFVRAWTAFLFFTDSTDGLTPTSRTCLLSPLRDGQYDEAYLNTLYGDDAAAMREMQRAQKDVGLIDNQVRPTYCNDRYYRARAGGGGC